MNRLTKIIINTHFVFILLSMALFAKAQHRTCGAYDVFIKQMATDTMMQKNREEIEKFTKEFKSRNGVQERSSIEVTIPVVINVVWNTNAQNISDQQIQSQLDILNEDFRKLNADVGGVPSAYSSVVADCEINFCLATHDPTGGPTNGIRRRQTSELGFVPDDKVKFTQQGGLDAWDREKYLNIWVCHLYDILGYGQHPGGQANTDGVVIDFEAFGNTGTAAYPYNRGRTATHEIGHWLDLFHIWGDDNGACNGTDFVDDTPNQASENFGCPSFPHISCNNGPNGDMFMNYLDYTDDRCMFMFTEDQKIRMQAMFTSNGFRATLLDSPGCQEPCTGPYTVTDINSNTLFDTDRDMPGDIHIHSGAQLTIEAIVGMREGTKIIVDRNARIIIDNEGVVTKGCDGPDWLGIQVLGNNLKAQPEHDATLTDAEQAGIVWIDNARVEFARCGVSAGGGYGKEYWGGLIWTNNAYFVQNRKDVEFMSYKFTTNKSRFFNTAFAEIEDVFSGTEGVTIWETDDIEFHNCTFNDKDLEGIRTYDAGVRILDGCDFAGNLTGISTFATYPMSNKLYIGSGTGPANNFEHNKFHINASLSTGMYGMQSDGLFSMDVINNNFSGGDYGVIIDGPSNFKIEGNTFSDVGISNWVANTGFNEVINFNFIGCNTFDQGTNIGILTIGENREMSFLANEFDMSSGNLDFVLINSFYPSNNGRISELQGNPYVPALNCFTNPGTQDDILTWGTTQNFKYYFEPEGYSVDCNSEPLTSGNYNKYGVQQGLYTVDCSQYGSLPGGLENPTLEDLDNIKSVLLQLFPYIETDINIKVRYYQALQIKDAILRYLLNEDLVREDYSAADSLLIGEQSKSADWTIFGLHMGRKDFSGATQWLNQLPLQEPEDTLFREIQLINIQRLQDTSGFQLSTVQEAYLDTIAAGSSPVRGFARGIIGLLENHRFYPEEIEIDQERRQSSSAIESKDLLKISPVPASNYLYASWPILPEDSEGSLQVLDCFGNQRINMYLSQLENHQMLNIGNFPSGIYFLMVSEHGKPVYKAKFIVL